MGGSLQGGTGNSITERRGVLLFGSGPGTKPKTGERGFQKEASNTGGRGGSYEILRERSDPGN